jgi:hypothetical protein
MKKIIILIFFIFLAGCATSGPEPTNKEYNQATESLNFAKDQLFSISASWFPNTIFTGYEFPPLTPTRGRLFIFPKRLIFAAYDDSTNRFLKGYEIEFAKITWVIGKPHGVSRIIKLQADNTVQSFVFGELSKKEGQDKDQIMEYILNSIKN